MKLTNKYPTIKSSSHQQALFESSNKEQSVSNTPEATIIGSLTFIAYILVFISIYGTAYHNKKLSLIPTGSKSSDHGFTMSEAFQYCNKNIATILIVIFFGLLQTLYTIQNFNVSDTRRIAVIATNYMLLLGWLLLYFVYGSNTVLHSMVASLVVICTLVNTLMVTQLYNTYYLSADLNIINYPSYLIIGIYVSIFLVFGISFIYFNIHKKLSVVIQAIIGSFEIFGIIMFAIFIILFSQLPELPDPNNLVCSYVA